MITRDNYEAFFLDYLDGNLKEEQIDLFLDFLEQNPDLKMELQQLENLNIPAEQIVFEEKKGLYKTAEDEKAAIEDKMIASLEGDLAPDESQLFKRFLDSQPELKKEYGLFQKTRLIPDSRISYPGKKRLYQTPARTIIFNWVARAAAVIVLIWGINSLFQDKNGPLQQENVTGIAEVSPKAVPPVKKMETEKKNHEAETSGKEKPSVNSKQAKPKSLRENTRGRLEEKRSADSQTIERDMTAYAMISPLSVQLETEPISGQLIVPDQSAVPGENVIPVMRVEEFLALKAREVGNEGLLSARRIIRAGLGIASEISGERIGFREQNGKITSVDFESKLLAFSIPLKKD